MAVEQVVSDGQFDALLGEMDDIVGRVEALARKYGFLVKRPEDVLTDAQLARFNNHMDELDRRFAALLDAEE